MNTSGRSSVSRFALLAGVIAGTLCGTAGAATQSYKLNGPMDRPLRGEVEGVQVSPDGAWTIFKAYSETGQSSLLSVPTKGGNPVELQIVPGYTVRIRISPDSRDVLYSNGDLYQVPIDGSRGSSELAPDSGVFEFTPDGARVVYGDGPYSATALHSVPLDGSAEPVRLTAPLVEGGAITYFQVGPGSRLAPGGQVFYLADAETNGVTELYSVPADGSRLPVKLNGPLAARADVSFFQISARAGRVVYLADQETDGVFELYSVPIDGGFAPVRLHSTRIRNTNLQVSPDGRRVVFVAEPERQNVLELLSVPIDGSQLPVRLNRTLPEGGDVISFEIAPDSERVVFVADQDEDEVFELYSAGIDGRSGPLEIHHPLQPGEDLWTFRISPGGERVVYSASSGSSSSLYSVPLLGGQAPVKLTGALGSFLLSPEGSRVVFVGLEAAGIGRGLYSVSIEGGADPRLLDADGRSLIAITPDGVRVVYKADKDLPFVFELFSVPVDGGHEGVPLNHPLSALLIADVVSFQVSPDGDDCAFIVRAETCDCDDSGSYELHGVGLDPRSPATRLADEIGQVRFSPDGAWVVFLSRLDDGEDYGGLSSVRVHGGLEPIEIDESTSSFAMTPDGSSIVFSRGNPMPGIYRAPIDGSSPAVALASTGEVQGLQLSPDGSRVVYAQKTGGAFELFSVPTDGSGQPIQLNDVSYPRGYPWSPFLISPDGRRVVYWTDQETDQVVELFSVPIDGTTSPTKLSGTMVPGGGLEPHVLLGISPDSRRVVYRADALVDGVTELFSVPIDGSASPLRLNAPLPAGGDVLNDFGIVPGGSRVIYRADQSGNDVFELFSVPIDAAAPPVRLNGPLVAGGDVSGSNSYSGSAFQVTPDGGRVVYLADQYADEVFELFSAAVNGSAAPRRVGGPSVPGGDVRDPFEITRDGKRVVYMADHDTDETVELYEAPVAGGKGRKLNARLVEGGDVAGSRVTPDGQWVLYKADQDTDTVQELYLTPLIPLPPAPRALPQVATRSRP